MSLFVDHIVISVRNLKKSIVFYQKFLGKPTVGKWDASWRIGETKLFLTFPYKKSAKKFSKHDLGLNHVAFGVHTLAELKRFEKLFDRSKIKHSGIQVDKYAKKKFIWFDDLDGMRLELYNRPSR